ncbi:hypothetical protein [Streptomyces sp. NPDC050255]|uniref:hypothetical protein n=1 Tax=Streptomyces sp. NPDC050255 TaxID=3365606 RepID=UPI0037BDC556
MQTPARMTVADLREALAAVPDWAAVQVITYDADGCASEEDPHIDYGRGVLTIDVA